MSNIIIREDLCNIIKNNLIPWDNLRNKTVLISGASGFVPAYIVETLLYLSEMRDLKIKVLALVRNKEKAVNRFADYINRSELTLLVQDVCKPISIEGQVDFIIHAASQASPKFYLSDPVGTLAANVVGTQNLLEIARRKNTQGFIFLSSSEVYGKVSQDQIPISEDMFGSYDPLQDSACYGESKRMGETMCFSYMQQFEIPMKIVRLFHTYGPGMQLDDGRVFADFVCDIVNKRDIIVKSDGRAIRGFCYLADVAGGIFTVLLKGKVGEAYNIGSDCAVSILELANILARLFPARNLRVKHQYRSLSDSYIESRISISIPNISKIKQLGWEPRYPIKVGFNRTVRSFES